ncbi:MAG: sensor histidine kinase [Saprospiraceae bacterium]
MPSIIIILKHLFWWSLLLIFLDTSSLNWGWTISNKHPTLLSHLYGTTTNAIIFYGTSFYLIPRFFNRRLTKKMVGFSMLFLLGITFLEVGVDSYLGAYLKNPVYLSAQDLTTTEFVFEGFIYAFPINLLYYIGAFAYRNPIDRKRLYERQLNLEKEKLAAELKYLKAQMHPHTLFNGLGSIYYLIDTEPEKAKSLLLNLSNALRYHLYESSERFTDLSKELNYLRQYIKMQQIRVEDSVDVQLHFAEYEEELLIAPLLLTPFIENAFKYVSHHPEKSANQIQIELKITASKMQFHCRNTIDEERMTTSANGGIGLPNVRNRLDLLYENQYDLQVEQAAGWYSIKLELPLMEK